MFYSSNRKTRTPIHWRFRFMNSASGRSEISTLPFFDEA